MESFLHETKERGNLSFSKDEDAIGIYETETEEVSKLSSSLTATTPDHTTNTSGTPSACAVLCEAINALERSKQAQKELKFANALLQ